MNIEFKNKYKSIVNFNKTALEDFSVFLGVNGSGKTHLLEAIQKGSVGIDNINEGDVLYFNLKSFSVENQKEFTPRSVEDQKQQAWSLLVRYKDRFVELDSQIKSIVDTDYLPYSISDSESVKQTISQILINIDSYARSDFKLKMLLKSGIFDSGEYASEITQKTFFKFSNYNLDDYELLNNLSEIFIEYQKKIVLAGLSVIDGGEGLTKEEVEKIKKNAPWNFINSMFEEFGLSHRMVKPEFVAGDLMQSQSITFQAKLEINDEEINFDDLSSGEKILCSLAITVYQDNSVNFPKILLLDEIDAPLHPTMIKNLLDVIEKIFIKNDCKVILATHSPTTVALVEEGSLFLVSKGDVLEKISKISQLESIDILSEGIITFEKGLSIVSEVDKTKDLQIMTEGNNSRHIIKAISVLEKGLLDRIKVIEIATSGAQQLKNAFDIMSKASSDNKFLFVWDCDFYSKVDKIIETDSFGKFCFETNSENTKSKDSNGQPAGIENLYSDDLFTNDVYSTEEKKGPYGGSITVKKFKKAEFLSKIEELNEEEVFEKYKPLIVKIKEFICWNRQI